MMDWRWLGRMFQRSRPEERASETLARFLAAQDLDDLLHIALELPPLDQNDQAVVQVILQDWRPAQAVANLLFHVDKIPEDLRGAAVLRGLNDQSQPYFQLAATAGLQSLEPAALHSAEAATIRKRLLQILQTDSLVAARASVTVDGWLDASFAPPLCRLLDHPNETVRHNLLAWLILHVEPVDLIPQLENSGARPETLAGAIRDVREYARCRRAGVEFTRASSYFYSYMPNLFESSH
jgi:hypothetical protein